MSDVEELVGTERFHHIFTGRDLVDPQHEDIARVQVDPLHVGQDEALKAFLHDTFPHNKCIIMDGTSDIEVVGGHTRGSKEVP